MPIDNNGQSVQNNSQPPFVWQNSQILQQNKSNNFLIFVQQKARLLLQIKIQQKSRCFVTKPDFHTKIVLTAV